MSEIKVNFGGLAQAASDVQTGVVHIRSQLESMNEALAKHRENWTGEARLAYDATQARWNATLDDMQALLADVGTAVSTSGENYLRQEQHNRDRWA